MIEEYRSEMGRGGRAGEQGRKIERDERASECAGGTREGNNGKERRIVSPWVAVCRVPARTLNLLNVPARA